VLHVLAAVSVAGALWWAWSLHAIRASRRGIPPLREDRSPSPARWPRVSVIVPARNEERDLERGLRTRLADDYPDLQLIVVDDRSTDATPGIADRLAAEDARVTVVHVSELPAGWLGKLHALARGVEVADGSWLLFSDADVEIAPGTLRRAVALCEHDARDHMSVVPGFREHGAVVDAVVDVFSQMLLCVGRPWRARDPASRVALGAGLFNLVRRAAYERTPGLQWLRLEIADDLALGQMLKRHGARPIVMNAVGSVQLDFYRDVGEMAWAMEKSGFAVIGRFNPAVMVLVCLAAVTVEAGFLAGFAHPALWVKALASITLVTAFASQASMARWMGRSVLPALLFPLGIALMGWMVLRSGVLVWRRGGVDWRGTVHTVRELRAGSRLEIR